MIVPWPLPQPEGRCPGAEQATAAGGESGEEIASNGRRPVHSRMAVALMGNAFGFLTEHAYVALFAVVAAEQIGLPVPATPFLLAAGALVAAGKVNPWVALAAAVAGSWVSDFAWYLVGRWRGRNVMALVCRIALEPDSCVRRTDDLFGHYGPPSLMLAKFIPPLGLVTPPLAGAVHMAVGPFVLFDTAGAGLWAGMSIGLGVLFARQVGWLAVRMERLGWGLAAILLGGLGLYLVWKYAKRRRLLRGLRTERISPDALKRKLDAGEPVLIVDLRHPLDAAADPQRIPGAMRLGPEEVEERQAAMPRDRETVLYCS